MPLVSGCFVRDRRSREAETLAYQDAHRIQWQQECHRQQCECDVGQRRRTEQPPRNPPPRRQFLQRKPLLGRPDALEDALHLRLHNRRRRSREARKHVFADVGDDVLHADRPQPQTQRSYLRQIAIEQRLGVARERERSRCRRCFSHVFLCTFGVHEAMM